MKRYERRVQVAKAIQKELANYIQCGGLKDDRVSGLITIVDVELNHSLSSARVDFSVIDTGDNADDEMISVSGTQAALDDKSGYLSGFIARKLNLKYAPRLVFKPSDRLRKSVDLVNLIDKTVMNDYEKRTSIQLED